MTEERKISERYRELSRDEPPRHVDETILAAARRAAETRPAPLVVPSGRRRWYFPLAAAAIIVLAVAVTVQVERQQPDPEVAIAPVTAPKPPAEEQVLRSDRAAEPAKPAAKAEVFVPDPKPRPPPAERKERPAAGAIPPPAPASPPADAVSGVRESARAEAAAEQRARAEAAAEDRVQAETQRAPARPARSMASMVAEPPERWLERIAELRKEGKHEEADKALAEFRQRYPDYEIPKAMLERVERK